MPKPSRRRLPIATLILALLAVAGVGLAYRQGLVPSAFSPLPVIDLAYPRGWTGGLLIDWQLAELKGSAQLCQRVLRQPHIQAKPVPDNPYEERCGWRNAVSVSAAGGVRVAANPLTCQMAAALAIWLEHDVQALARSYFGSEVRSVQTMGSYACRNIVGNQVWQGLRSQHAFANALDVGGFTLANGKRISVQRDWKGTGSEAKFLRAVHGRACRYFRVVLGPDFNASHRDHFHFDRGSFWTCR